MSDRKTVWTPSAPIVILLYVGLLAVIILAYTSTRENIEHSSNCFLPNPHADACTISDANTDLIGVVRMSGVDPRAWICQPNMRFVHCFTYGTSDRKGDIHYPNGTLGNVCALGPDSYPICDWVLTSTWDTLDPSP